MAAAPPKSKTDSLAGGKKPRVEESGLREPPAKKAAHQREFLEWGCTFDELQRLLAVRYMHLAFSMAYSADPLGVKLLANELGILEFLPKSPIDEPEFDVEDELSSIVDHFYLRVELMGHELSEEDAASLFDFPVELITADEDDDSIELTCKTLEEAKRIIDEFDGKWKGDDDDDDVDAIGMEILYGGWIKKYSDVNVIGRVKMRHWGHLGMPLSDVFKKYCGDDVPLLGDDVVAFATRLKEKYDKFTTSAYLKGVEWSDVVQMFTTWTPLDEKAEHGDDQFVVGMSTSEELTEGEFSYALANCFRMALGDGMPIKCILSADNIAKPLPSVEQFPASSKHAGWSASWLNRDDDEFCDRALLLIDHIIEEGEISDIDLAKKLEMSDSKVKLILEYLYNKGILTAKHTGPNYGDPIIFSLNETPVGAAFVKTDPPPFIMKRVTRSEMLRAEVMKRQGFTEEFIEDETRDLRFFKRPRFADDRDDNLMNAVSVAAFQNSEQSGSGMWFVTQPQKTRIVVNVTRLKAIIGALGKYPAYTEHVAIKNHAVFSFFEKTASGGLEYYYNDPNRSSLQQTEAKIALAVQKRQRETPGAIECKSKINAPEGWCQTWSAFQAECILSQSSCHDTLLRMASTMVRATVPPDKTPVYGTADEDGIKLVKLLNAPASIELLETFADPAAVGAPFVHIVL